MSFGPRATIAICAAIVLTGAIGARVLASASWNSVVSYHTPYILQPRTPFGQRLVDHVLLVVIDGLRLDQSRELPEMNTLRAQGADGESRAGLPSLSNPARAVFSTGSWQEVNGVTNNSAYIPPKGRSVFSNANAVGIRVAFAGIDFWKQNYGMYAREDFPSFGKEPHDLGVDAISAYQRKLCGGIVPFVGASQARLIVVDLTAVDIISHDFGAVTPEAKRIRGEVDSCLQQVVAKVDLAKTVVIVTSDHGHLDTGGHGGEEEEVMRTPLVIAGQGVRRASGIRAEQVDIAPTICGLLGIPIPSMNQGRFLAEAFDFPPATIQEVQDRVEQQRAMFHRVQQRILGGDRAGAPLRARSLRLGPAVALALCIAVGVGWILAGACHTTRERGELFLATMLYNGVYYALFRNFHLAYSLSAVNREEFLNAFLFKGMLVSALATALLGAAVAVTRERTVTDRVRLFAAFAALISLTWMAQVLRIYYLNGITITAWMFDLTQAFTCYLDLLALIGVAVGGVAGALLLWAIASLLPKPASL